MSWAPGDRERGELRLRLIIAMALVAGMAWTVPMVFFGREATRNAATLAGASDAAASPDAARGEAMPVDPIGRADDMRSQAALNSAIRVAQVYFAENASYVGFGPEVATSYDPTLRMTSGPATPDVLSLRGVTATTVVLVAATQGGGFLCAAASSELVTFGRADAATPAQCSGGWEPA